MANPAREKKKRGAQNSTLTAEETRPSGEGKQETKKRKIYAHRNVIKPLAIGNKRMRAPKTSQNVAGGCLKQTPTDPLPHSGSPSFSLVLTWKPKSDRKQGKRRLAVAVNTVIQKDTAAASENAHPSLELRY
jgi:hypothetical protein